MIPAFWDRTVILNTFVPQDETIKSARYWETPKNYGGRGACFMTIHVYDSFGWDTISQPAYSPDTAPSDFYILSYIVFYGWKKFSTDDEVKSALKQLTK